MVVKESYPRYFGVRLDAELTQSIEATAVQMTTAARKATASDVIREALVYFFASRAGQNGSHNGRYSSAPLSTGGDEVPMTNP